MTCPLWKKYLPTILGIFCFSSSFSQSPVSFYLNHASNDCKFSFSSDAIYFIEGPALNLLIKTDYDGNVIWTKTGGTFSSLVIDEGSIYFLYNNYYVVKMDTAGNNIWARNVSGPMCPASSGPIALTVSRGRVFISRRNFQAPPGTSGMNTFDTSGVLLSSWCDLTNQNNLIVESYPRIPSGAWLNFLRPGVSSQASIIPIDSSGNIDTLANSIYLDMDDQVWINDIIPLADSTYLAVTTTDSGQFTDDFRTVLTRFRNDGTVIWQKTIYSLNEWVNCYRAGTDSSANIYLIGNLDDGITYKDFLMKLDSSGNVIISYECIHPPVDLMSYSRMEYHHGNLYCPCRQVSGLWGVMVFDTLLNSLCGISQAPFSPLVGPDTISTVPWVPFTNATYTQVNSTYTIANYPPPVSADLCAVVSQNEITNEPSFQIIPNPAGFSFSINISTASSVNIIEIYNLLGEKILTVVNRESLIVNCESLTPGIYFVKASNENGSSVQKLVKQ